MKKGKSIFEKMKVYWDNGKIIADSDAKLGFYVKNHAVNQIFATFKANSSALSDIEKKAFQEMVRQLTEDKKLLGNDNKVTREEFVTFLEVCFHNVDEQDRHGTVTMETSQSFKTLAELIDVLPSFGSEIEEDWNKKSKYIF